MSEARHAMDRILVSKSANACAWTWTMFFIAMTISVPRILQKRYDNVCLTLFTRRDLQSALALRSRILSELTPTSKNFFPISLFIYCVRLSNATHPPLHSVSNSLRFWWWTNPHLHICCFIITALFYKLLAINCV